MLPNMTSIYFTLCYLFNCTMNMDQPRNIKGKENLGSRESWWDRRRESVMFLFFM